MKKTLNLFIAVLFSIAVQAQFSDKDPYLSKSFSSESIKEVFARTSGGNIGVSGGSGEARVEVFIQGNNGRSLSKEEIKQRLEEDYKLVVAVDGDQLTVTAEPKDTFFNWKRALSISFKVYVPERVSTDLKTSGGSITMKNLAGTHNFATSGGSLDLDRLSGRIKGRTSGGSIDVSNTKDNIDLATSGGSVEAEHCTGTINLSTSGGQISLRQLDGTIRVNTSGGPIHADDIKGELNARTSGGGVHLKDLACSVDASTSGGNMEIEINQLEDFVTVRNSGGNIRVTMPGNKGLNLKLHGDRINIPNMNNFTGNKDEHKVEGKLNGGGVPVNIQTSGSITVALN